MNATVKTVLLVLGVVIVDRAVGISAKIAKMINPNAA